MYIPRFKETNHPLIQALQVQSDAELLKNYQEYPEQGKFFTAIFCRYHPIVYSLITETVVNLDVAEYFSAIAWRQFFYELRGLVLNPHSKSEFNCLQDWLIRSTNIFLEKVEVPESMNYDFNTTPPPLWCYVEASLDTLNPLYRFILVMNQKFNWSTTRITTYLHSEGDFISLTQVNQILLDASLDLQANLPQDIQLIYLQS